MGHDAPPAAAQPKKGSSCPVVQLTPRCLVHPSSYNVCIAVWLWHKTSHAMTAGFATQQGTIAGICSSYSRKRSCIYITRCSPCRAVLSDTHCQRVLHPTAATPPRAHLKTREPFTVHAMSMHGYLSPLDFPCLALCTVCNSLTPFFTCCVRCPLLACAVPLLCPGSRRTGGSFWC